MTETMSPAPSPDDTLAVLTHDEKLRLASGADAWHTAASTGWVSAR